MKGRATRGTAETQTDDRDKIVFGELKKIISPKGSVRWQMLINGHTVALSTRHLGSQSKFRNRCIEVVHVSPRKLSGEEWIEFVNTKLRECPQVVEEKV